MTTWDRIHIFRRINKYDTFFIFPWEERQKNLQAFEIKEKEIVLEQKREGGGGYQPPPPPPPPQPV